MCEHQRRKEGRVHRKETKVVKPDTGNGRLIWSAMGEQSSVLLLLFFLFVDSERH